MRHDSKDEKLLAVVVDGGSESVLVTGDIENRHGIAAVNVHGIGGGIEQANVSDACPSGGSGGFVPGVQ